MSALTIASRRCSLHMRLRQTQAFRVVRFASDNSKPEASREQAKGNTTAKNADGTQPTSKKPRKTQAELDEELRLKMAGLAGDGGDSGIEYEDGQPASMKRSVKENMFRYI